MKIRPPIFLFVIVPFICCMGCAQKRMNSTKAQVFQEDVAVADKAYREIDEDLDALRDELKTSERVLGTLLGQKIYNTLNQAKQAVKERNYEKSRECYRKAVKLARAYLIDESTVKAFRQALAKMERRFDDKGPCEAAWADLMGLFVKEQLRRIVIPDFEMGPPQTLIDAVDFFKQASRDYDDPKIPIEQRGISFVLKLSAAQSAAVPADNDKDPFAVSDNSLRHDNAPVIFKISARYISLYDAITLVCDSTGYTFDTRNGFVLIMPRDSNVELFKPKDNKK